MRLSQLRPSPADAGPAGSDPDIAGLTADSRAVRPGFVFAALSGVKTDGRAFIADALAKGAVAVLAPEGTVLPADSATTHSTTAVLLTDPQPRLAFARMAAAFHGGRQPGTVVAVTGTNGKTSTVQFAAQIWTHMGLAAGSMGTLGLIGPGLKGYGGMTTPDPVSLHRDLAAAKEAGIDHLAMEASSHGLEQFRLDGVAIKAAGFTNLTLDHLDYHGTMDAYRDAKAMLFQRILPTGCTAVLNADSDDFHFFAAICNERGHRVLSYGLAGTGLRVTGVEALAHGQRLCLSVLGHEVTVDLPLAGRFQAWNVLCALGLVIGSGGDVEQALAALPTLEGVPGRLQHVATHPNGAAVYVDFAHTPDALETVLLALRSHASRHLVTVFGCGGDRDRTKRPVMGALAARLADRAIVTDDNPRTENPAFVRSEVLAGAAGELAGRLEEIGDRAEAIRTAVQQLQPGDVLVIAGKGHEQGQTIGTEVRPFDDADEARKAVAEVGA
ncbi:UDP-N-acetylmuramoylalanyl-D-glutamate--2,6-diaminopimelate ligase [Azospirillum thiophilum]|uniref:UDP-N-acetylmuramoyl-L-alanyl-D-glutamate--2,6-diaminopimelate ligase n=1 Tax=Azospirillum thiophilum TaxID=528244 RepID=A0AAC8VX33_9PROT|nr:UDP-N-acetylmuramoyl-L-alanyl-D-glutamate--2,6-diaminopimelate ligase [Azospirillum thiophilum]ALG70953.1 UDP-N-acetylmuramoylalanyl-D-glutamate--2,6-diaminopimelate ligase [Azospirillum thiophilum]KJR65383.1 UDP-N-acetylmuramoylalanyl-D-glutamate--2,6-diaminopimelate ligase [Azospirillum thiophilum]